MDPKELATRFESVAVIHTTPFGPDGAVDEDGLRRHVRFLVDNGVTTLVSNGNTGEFYSLTLQECYRVLEIVAEEVGSDVLLVAGIGHDPHTVVEMARHAQKTGAEAVMVHNPVHPYLMGEGLKAYFDRIAEAVAIGVIPYVRSAAMDIEVLTHIARHRNVVACKYAINDLQLFGDVVRALPTHQTGITWQCGTAEAWAPFFYTAGARGFTSGLANLAPEMSLDMLAALQRGDRERTMELWHAIRPFEAMRARHNSGLNVSVVKAAMEMVGLPSGGVRPPIAPLGPSERAELAAILEAWGILPEAANR